MNWTRRRKLIAFYIGLPVVIGTMFLLVSGDRFPMSEIGNDVQPMFLCKRGPQSQIVDSSIINRDTCSASAKIQVIQYACTAKGREYERMSEFLKIIGNRGEERCKSFCREVGDCGARFTRPGSCGFSVNPKKGSAVGSRVGCHFACEGPSFAYCSIYHGGYISSDSDMLKRDLANCRCVPR